MDRLSPSLLDRQLERCSRLLQAPRRRHARRVQGELRLRLLELLEGLQAPARTRCLVLEGVMALALADGAFGDEEWSFFSSLLAELDLPPDQLEGLSHHEGADLASIAAGLATLAGPQERRAIAEVYGLFAAADGEPNPAETAVLRSLLQALGEPGLEAEMGHLYPHFRLRLHPLQRLRVGLGDRLARWLGRRRRVRA